jgi:hypothetical protein
LTAFCWRCTERAWATPAMRPIPFEDLVTAVIEDLAPDKDTRGKDRRRDRVKGMFERMVSGQELTVDEGMISLASEALAFKLVPEAAANDSDPNDDLTSGGVS